MATAPVGPTSTNLGLAMRRLNELQRAGLIKEWAIGGAFAAMYYSEPVLSYDIDVFTELPTHEGLISLTPIYVPIEGIPIQFLPVSPGSLEEDAERNALEINLDDEPARVFSMEHTLAIALKTYRRKDRERIGHLLETGTTKPNEGALNSLLKRFSTPEADLLKRWQEVLESDGSK
jgi:hypothetical protein